MLIYQTEKRKTSSNWTMNDNGQHLSLLLFVIGSICCSFVYGEDVNRPKREPQHINPQSQWNKPLNFQQIFNSSNNDGGGGLHRSFSTGDLDQIGRRRRPGTNNNDNGANNGQSCNLNYDFDYFVLAIQWPSSFCLEKQECNMKIARKKKWLIHGLWPNRQRHQALGRNRRDNNLAAQRQFSNSDPNLLGHHNNAEFCCGPRYNSSLIKGQIYQELLDKWPTLHPSGRHHSFWQHEWQKHGTCARQVRPLQTQLKYFETILGLYNRFNLSAANFQNGRSYKINEIHQNIEPRVGNFKVRLECSLIDSVQLLNPTNSTGRQNQQQQSNSQTLGHHNNNNNSQRTSIFSEVHICLDKTLRPMNCPHRDDYQCKKSILFP